MRKMLSFKPAVTSFWLFLLAGILWSAVGLMLSTFAYRWLVRADLRGGLWFGLSGLVLSLAVYRFGFLRIARQNIHRLEEILEKVCLFAFVPWKSYLLIVGMMSLGMLLRGSAIPREALAVLYLAIGGGLFFSSLHYYPPFLTGMLRAKAARLDA